VELVPSPARQISCWRRGHLPSLGPARLAIVLAAGLLTLAVHPVASGAQTPPAPTTTTTTAPGSAPPTGDPAVSTTVTAPPPTAPPGADENARRAANADLAAAKKALADAVRAETAAKKRAAGLDKALSDLDARRRALAATEQKAAEDLEISRSLVRQAAIATYVGGGNTSIANQIARADTIDRLGRDRVYGANVIDAGKRAIATFRNQLENATDQTLELGRDADRVKADRGLVVQELEAASSLRVQREADVAQRNLLTQLVTAAAPVLPSDIPALFLEAYVRAAAAANRRTPTCKIHWTALAAIGRTESGHGRSGGAALTLAGDAVPRILGPRLDGNGFARITDTDGGVLDGDLEFDRAVGPMQFIPSTWKFSGQDGNGDGVADPNNAWDAATASAMYLCRAAQGLDDEQNLYRAALSYNHSDAYAQHILTAAREYGALGLAGVPPAPPPPNTPVTGAAAPPP
jgi:membrane-bound lytic murein transglycosylase B